MARSQFYGKLTGRSQTAATRCGNKDSGLSVLAASKTGAITVELRHWDGKDCFVVYLQEWGSSSFGAIPLASGHFPTGEGDPTLHLHDPTVRMHIEQEAHRIMAKED